MQGVLQKQVLTPYGLAESFANACWGPPAIKSISLAGAGAKNGESDDHFDIIFYVDEDTFNHYLAEAKKWESRCYNFISSQKPVAIRYRYGVVLWILGIDRQSEKLAEAEAMWDEFHSLPDLFILPDGYQGKRLGCEVDLSVYDKFIIEPMRGLEDKSGEPLERNFDPKLRKFTTKNGAPLIFPIWSTV